MIYLSNVVLRYAVNICFELSNYHVVIFPSSKLNKEFINVALRPMEIKQIAEKW